ncbi:MAG: isopenicillin N synthase family dioxygenase [Agromyces sp.]
MNRLPVLDFSRATGTAEERAAFQTELLAVTHEIGFFYLTGHGIPDEEFDELIALAHAFFALPEADKLAIENTNSPHFRGYTRIGGELTQGKTDWREQIDIGIDRPAPNRDDADFWVLQGPNLWPDALPQLRPAVEAWMQRLSELSRTLLSLWAEALGSPSDVFDEAFAAESSPLLKIVRYPGVPEGRNGQGVGAHKDLGVLTLLYVEEGKAGLQVEHNGEWIDAPPVPRAFVVNIGELLESATDGYLKATLHRVVSPEHSDERISIPFFYAPALDATIPQLELPLELRERARGVERDPANPIHAVYGHNWLKSRVRAHPNVVDAHHPHLRQPS